MTQQPHADPLMQITVAPRGHLIAGGRPGATRIIITHFSIGQDLQGVQLTHCLPTLSRPSPRHPSNDALSLRRSFPPWTPRKSDW
jgi:hypothetical protein